MRRLAVGLFTAMAVMLATTSVADAMTRDEALGELQRMAASYEVYAKKFKGFHDPVAYASPDYMEEGVPGSGQWRGMIFLDGYAGGRWYMLRKVCEVWARDLFTCGTFKDLRYGDVGW